MKLCVVYVKNRKRFDKYVKKGNISNKLVIDIRKIMEDEEIDDRDLSTNYFKLQLWKRIEWALGKKKDIFYIPWTRNPLFDAAKTISIKELIPDDYAFEGLMFHQDFKNDPNEKVIYSILPEFDRIAVIEE